EMPYTLNPVEGYIAPVNNKIIGDDYDYFIASDWDYGFRANRIVEMFKSAPGKIDLAYFQKMQGDDYDASAEIYVPLLLQMNPQFAKQNEGNALDLLKDWD